MEFMVSIRFRAQDMAEIATHIPQEQIRVKELMEQGVLKSIYISADRLSVWIVMQGETQEQVQKELEAFPLYPYMELELVSLLKM